MSRKTKGLRKLRELRESKVQEPTSAAEKVARARNAQGQYVKGTHFNRKTGQYVDVSAHRQGAGTVPWKPGDRTPEQRVQDEIVDLYERGLIDD